MQVQIKADIASAMGKGSADPYKAKAHKTKTILTLTADTYGQWEDAVKAVKTCGLKDGRATVSVEITDSKNIGNLALRSVVAMANMGITADVESEYGMEMATLTLKTGRVPLSGEDVPYLTEMMTRLGDRGKRALSGTQHPLTIFDLNQAIGAVHEAKEDEPWALATIEWAKGREAIVLGEKKEAIRAKREKEQEAANKERDKKAVAKAKEKATKVKAKAQAAKAAAKGKGKGGSEGGDSPPAKAPKATANLGAIA